MLSRKRLENLLRRYFQDREKRCPEDLQLLEYYYNPNSTDPVLEVQSFHIRSCPHCQYRLREIREIEVFVAEFNKKND